MRYLLVLIWLFSSITHADIFQGQEKEGYFYPDFQAWRVVEARPLSPSKVNPQLSGIPIIMRGSLLFFSNNYFTMKSVNTGGNLIFPACFIQDETAMQAHIVDDQAKSYLGEYFDFNVGKKGILYFSVDGKFLFGMKPEPKFDASQRPKFENVIEKSQNMKAQGEIIKEVQQRLADKPEALAKYLPIMKKNMKTLLQKKECEFIEPKKVVEVKSKSLKVIFPQLNQQMIVPDGLVDLGENIELSSSIARHKYPRSIEYIRKNGCVSDVLFSDYTDSTASFITRGFMGASDEAAQAKSVMESEQWKRWFATYFQLQGLMLKVTDFGMGDAFNMYARSTCHRELYRKRLDFPKILSQFNGFQGFSYNNQTLSIQSDSWKTDDLLELKAQDFKLSIYDNAPGELTVTMEYPVVKP